MAISTDAGIDFFGTQDTVTSGTGSLADATFVSAGSWTNDDDAPEAAVVLEATYSVAPTAGTTVDLYAKLDNIQSTNDADAPDANFPHYYLGSFPLNDVTSAQYIPIRINLPNTYTSQVYDFYIYNDGGQTISAGWDLYITPIALGPHA